MNRQILSGYPLAPMRRIGEAELVSERTFHVNTFECAAWWQDVTCKPQTVTMTANGYYVAFSFAGIVTAAYFPTMLGGLPVGAYDKSRDVGRAAFKTFHLYDYLVAQAIAHRSAVAGPDLVVRRDPGISVVGQYRLGIRPEPFFHFAVEVDGDGMRTADGVHSENEGARR